MNKYIKLGLVGLIGSSLFIGGSVVGANTNMLSGVISQANKDIGAAGYNKKQELLGDLDAVIEQKVIQRINPEIEEKKSEVELALDSYFDSKIDTITDGETYQQTLNQLDEIKQGIIERYKREIDNAFAEY